jgi:chromosome partitioning protein
MGKIISIVNAKGGVGKTTNAVNISSGLHQMGKRVLLVDTDPQGNATTYLGMGEPGGRGITDLLIKEVPLGDVVKSYRPGFDLVPSVMVNSRQLENDMTTADYAELRMISALENNLDTYDYIIIDCPPSLGKIVGSALCASDWFIVPLLPEPFSVEGIAELFRYVQSKVIKMNTKLRFAGFVINRYNSRKRNLTNMEVVAVATKMGHVFPTSIRENKSLYDAALEGRPIFDLYPDSNGAVDYENLCVEIINAIDGDKK